MKEHIQTTIRNLERNGFTVSYFATKEEAKDALLFDIGQEESIGFGGSVTVDQMGIYESFAVRGNAVYWHWKEGSDPASKRELQMRAAFADVYISSTNSITEDGRLINIDGTGNRLASMLYGHKRNYIVAGINKISRNYEEAMIRIKNVSSPKNTERLNFDTPCRMLGKCMNCSSSKRICNATLILDRQPNGQKTIIYLINESIGF